MPQLKARPTPQAIRREQIKNRAQTERRERARGNKVEVEPTKRVKARIKK